MAKKNVKTDQLKDNALGAVKQTALKKTDKATARQKKVRQSETMKHAAAPLVDTAKVDTRLPGRKGWPQEYDKYNLDTWLEKKVTDYKLDRDAIKAALCTRLREQGFELVLPDYTYRGKNLDALAIAAGRAVEYHILLSAQDLSDEMFNAAQFGKQARNWHVALYLGLLLPNMYYFVIPSGFIDIKELPAHAGVIEVEITPTHGQYAFTAVRPPKLLHREFIEPGSWRTIAKNIYEKLYINDAGKKV